MCRNCRGYGNVAGWQGASKRGTRRFACQRVLSAQEFLYSARNSVLSNKRAYLNAVVAIYQALGGGWRRDR